MAIFYWACFLTASIARSLKQSTKGICFSEERTVEVFWILGRLKICKTNWKDYHLCVLKFLAYRNVSTAKL